MSENTSRMFLEHWIEPENSTVTRLLEYARKNGIEIRMQHIEQMAAAYLLQTDIDPSEVVLVEEQAGYNRTVWYYARKSDLLRRYRKKETDGQGS